MAVMTIPEPTPTITDFVLTMTVPQVNRNETIAENAS
jgi:hypothetical protein